MNIEKLARHLKEFTLNEIKMLAECDCNNELEHLLISDKIVFEQGLYKYKENINSENYEIFTIANKVNKNILLNFIISQKNIIISFNNVI